MSTRSTRAIKGTLTSFLQYTMQIALQAVLVPVILKFAGQEAMGAYSIIMQIIGYGILLDCGFSVAFNRYLAQAFGIDDNGTRFKEVFNSGQVFILIVNLIFGFLIFILSFFTEDLIIANTLIQEQIRWSLYIFAFWTIVRSPIALYGAGLTAAQNMSTVNTIGIIGNAGRLLFSLLFVILGANLLGLVLAYIFADAVIFYFNRKCFIKEIPDYHFVWRIQDKKLFKEILRFGFRYWGVNLAVVLFYGSDSIIIGHFFGAAAVSIYYVTKMPTFLSFQFIWKLSDNAGPATNELFGKRDYTSIQNAYIKLLKYSLLLAITLALGVISFNRDAVSVWAGTRQYAGNIMTYCLAIFAILEIVNHLNAMIVVASGNMRWWSTISIAQGVISISLSIIFSKLIGLEGIMLGFLIGSTPMFIYLFYRSLTSIGLKLNSLWLVILKPSLIANVPLLFLTIFIKKINLVSSIINLMYFIPLFLIIWLIGLFFLGLDNSEKKYFSSLIKDNLWLRYQS